MRLLFIITQFLIAAEIYKAARYSFNVIFPSTRYLYKTSLLVFCSFMRFTRSLSNANALITDFIIFKFCTLRPFLSRAGWLNNFIPDMVYKPLHVPLKFGNRYSWNEQRLKTLQNGDPGVNDLPPGWFICKWPFVRRNHRAGN